MHRQEHNYLASAKGGAVDRALKASADLYRIHKYVGRPLAKITTPVGDPIDREMNNDLR